MQHLISVSRIRYENKTQFSVFQSIATSKEEYKLANPAQKEIEGRKRLPLCFPTVGVLGFRLRKLRDSMIRRKATFWPHLHEYLHTKVASLNSF